MVNRLRRLPWRAFENDLYDTMAAAKNRRYEMPSKRKAFVRVMEAVKNLEEELETPSLGTPEAVTKAKWETAITTELQCGNKKQELDPVTLWIIGLLIEFAYRWWLARRSKEIEAMGS